MQQMQGPGVVQRRRHQRRILDVGEHDHPEGRVDSVLQVQRVVGNRVRAAVAMVAVAVSGSGEADCLSISKPRFCARTSADADRR
jgi:hypothetical protein